MKSLGRFCATLVLTLALTLSAFAGEMSTGVVDPPPPPPSESQATTTGEMSAGVTGDISTGVAAINPVTEAALNVLQSVLSLF